MQDRYLWGLDLSLSCTGITIYNFDKREFVYIGHFNTEKIKTKKGLDKNAVKLKHIYDWLTEMKEQYPPSIVSIERGLSRFNTATQVIYRVHGITNLLFWDKPQVYYPPKTVKAVIYKGDATKAEVQRVIKNNFIDIEFANEDESDSFAVALTYLIEHELIQFEKPIVEKKKKKKKPEHLEDVVPIEDIVMFEGMTDEQISVMLGRDITTKKKSTRKKKADKE